MRILNLLFIISSASIVISCKDELRGGRTFVVGEESAAIQPDTILDEKTIREIDSLNLGIVDSIKIGTVLIVE